VHKGNVFFTPAMMKHLRNYCHDASLKWDVTLTSRQTQLLQLIAEGLPDKQSALELGICKKTVNKHRQKLMNKLRIHNAAGLTRYAIFNGVVSRDVTTKLDAFPMAEIRRVSPVRRKSSSVNFSAIIHA
jgi:DNA-binding NarL/FixJ family response regulator